jgi:hypothetical protein
MLILNLLFHYTNTELFSLSSDVLILFLYKFSPRKHENITILKQEK